MRESFGSGNNLVLVHKRHLENFTNDDVKVFKFDKEVVEQIPLGISKIFPNVEQAFFYGNGVKKIQRSDFEDLSMIIAISFYGNHISHTPENVFFDLKLLISISISHNTLQNLPDRIFNNQLDLQRVYLNNNYLITLQPEVFEKNNKLETVMLQNNLFSRIAPFDELLPIKSINLKSNFCIDAQITEQSEIKNLNDNLMTLCTKSRSDVIDLVEKCAEELNYCKMDEIIAQNKNKVSKNKKKRSLIL